MSRDAVTIASLTAERDAAQRHVRRLLHVLRAVGHVSGSKACPDYCFCGQWAKPAPAHSTACLAAARELLALDRRQCCERDHNHDGNCDRHPEERA